MVQLRPVSQRDSIHCQAACLRYLHRHEHGCRKPVRKIARCVQLFCECFMPLRQETCRHRRQPTLRGKRRRRLQHMNAVSGDLCPSGVPVPARVWSARSFRFRLSPPPPPPAAKQGMQNRSSLSVLQTGRSNHSHEGQLQNKSPRPASESSKAYTATHCERCIESNECENQPYSLLRSLCRLSMRMICSV